MNLQRKRFEVQYAKAESKQELNRLRHWRSTALLLTSIALIFDSTAIANPFTWKGTTVEDAPDQWHEVANWLDNGSAAANIPGAGDTVIVSSFEDLSASWTGPTNRAFANNSDPLVGPISIESLYVGGWPSTYDAEAGGNQPPKENEHGEVFLWTPFTLTTVDPIHVGYRGASGRFDHGSGLIDLDTEIRLGSGGIGSSLGQWHQRFESAEVKTTGFDVGISGSGLLQQNEGLIDCPDTYTTCRTTVGKGEDQVSSSIPYIPGSGMVHQTGGSFTTEDMIVGDQLGSGGIVTVHYPAEAHYGDLVLGEVGSGSLQITGGTVDVTNDVILGSNVGAFGQLVITGGDLTADSILVGADLAGTETGGAGHIMLNGSEGSVTVTNDFVSSSDSILSALIVMRDPYVTPINVGGDAVFNDGFRIKITLEEDYDNVENDVYDVAGPGPDDGDKYPLVALTGSGTISGVPNIEVVGNIYVGGGQNVPASDYWVIEVDSSGATDKLVARYVDFGAGGGAEILPMVPVGPDKSSPWWQPIVLLLFAAISIRWLTHSRARLGEVWVQATRRQLHSPSFAAATLVILILLPTSHAWGYHPAFWWQGSADGRNWSTSNNWVQTNGFGLIDNFSAVPNDTSGTFDSCNGAAGATLDRTYITSFNTPWARNGMKSPYPKVYIGATDNIFTETLYLGGWKDTLGIGFDSIVGDEKNANPATAWGMVDMSGGALTVDGYFRMSYRGGNSRFEQSGGTTTVCVQVTAAVYGNPGETMGLAEWHLRNSARLRTINMGAGVISSALFHQTGGFVECEDPGNCGTQASITIGGGWSVLSEGQFYVPGQGMYHMSGGEFDPSPLTAQTGALRFGSGQGTAGVGKIVDSGHIRTDAISVGVNGLGSLTQSSGSTIETSQLIIGGRETSSGTFSITGSTTTLALGPDSSTVALYLSSNDGFGNFILIGGGPEVAVDGRIDLGSRAMITGQFDAGSTIRRIHTTSYVKIDDPGARVQILPHPTLPLPGWSGEFVILVADGGIQNTQNIELDPISDVDWDLEFSPDGTTMSVKRTSGAPACADGDDNDGDGLIDYPEDPVCTRLTKNTESSHCQDGIDNDGDNLIDFDGGASWNNGVPLAGIDTWCEGAHTGNEKEQICGLGFELVLFVAPLLWLRSRRRALAIH